MAESVPLAVGEKIEMILNDVESYVTMIQDIPSDNVISVTVPFAGGREKDVKPGDRVAIIFFRPDGQYRCSVKVLRRYRYQKLHLLDIAVSSPIRRTQRRKYFRMDITLTVLFQRVRDNPQDPLYHYGYSMNMSGGGISILSPIPIPLKEKVECRITLGHEEISIVGLVVRCKSVFLSEERYEIALSFEDIPEKTRKYIIQYLFEEQRKLRRKDLL